MLIKEENKNRIINLKEKEVDEIVKKLIDAEDLTVLLYGKVQSGKTGTFLRVIRKFIDLGYENFYILTRNSLLLVDQTQKRSICYYEDLNGEIKIVDAKTDLKNLTNFEIKKITITII